MDSNTFKTKARAIELLGRKQIRDDVTALIELMKNSYDADAERLSVEFFHEMSEPYLVIYDTGHGMDMDDLLNKWLVLGTDSKKGERSKKRVSKVKERPLMGEKGIGRLASAALGEQFWMFTKSKKEKWHALFLNWNLFENQDLYLGDVNIPSLFGLEKEEIISSEKIKKLLQVQLGNLSSSAWLNNDKEPLEKHLELYKKIKQQISDQLFPVDHLEAILDEIDGEHGQGTVLVIQFLRTRWNDVFSTDNDRKADSIAQQRYNRLGSFVDTFSNLSPDFEVEIIYNNKKIAFNHYIDETLYELYDVKIKGEIIEGKFYGQLFALNADLTILSECNKELAEGIGVTSGIMNPEQKYCGPFKVEFCFFEQKERNSSLSKEQLIMLKERLATVGGIKVFRDGVRVLPYGDVENDFLGLEENRSKRAGYYLFSHRNMFGQIHVDSVNNPSLEDKSSREGLLENDQYYYFITAIKNLLYKIAVDYLGDSKKGARSLRSSYLSSNRKKFDDAKKASEAFENEKKETELAIKNLKQDLYSKRIRLDQFKFQKISYDFPVPPDSLNYSKISEKYTQFRKMYGGHLGFLEGLKNDLEVKINPRFEPSVKESLLEEIHEFNEYKDAVLLGELDRLSVLIDEFEKEFSDRFDEWHRLTSRLLDSNFEEYLKQNVIRVKSIDAQINSITSKLAKNIERVANGGLDKLLEITNVRQRVKEISKELQEPVFLKSNELKNQLRKAENILQSLKRLEPEDIISQSEQQESLIRTLEEELKTFEQSDSQRLEREAEKCVRQVIIETIDGLLREIDYIPKDDRIIGELKTRNAELERENEIFVDLANMGMAAEVVNHEFNQLFTNVKDGLDNIKSTTLNGTQKYWLIQIESGFKAISTRHSQLSPMYRSYNLRKRPIKLRNLVEDMIKFFSGRLAHAHIQVDNLIDPDFELLVSPSKMYPVFSNLIDNAIYWMLDRKEKTLLFRADYDKNCLYVEDTGPGINLRNSSRIFEPFFSQRRGGRGLGLSIVRKVLESQGHEITVIQDVFEKTLTGACFKVKFSDKDKVN